MNTDYTALGLIVDRSGSMESIAQEVRGSVKQFIMEQKKGVGKATLTATQFDHSYEVIHDFQNIQEIDEEKFANEYAPRGLTALLDAIGRATLAMKQKIDDMPETEKPKRVVIAVITDGYENASKGFTISQIKEMIKEREAAGWDFMFMGATLDTIKIAENMGFSKNKSAIYNVNNFKTCMSSVNEQATKARLNEEVKITEEDRENLKTSN